MLLTTSRRTSQRTRTFCKELASILPFCEYVTRGKKSIREIMDLGYSNAHKMVLIIESSEGNPYRMSSIDPSSKLEWGSQFNISIRTRKDMGINTKVPPLREDLAVSAEGEGFDESFKRLAEAFEASEGVESDVVVRMQRSRGKIVVDFIRKDISDDPVGPQILVRE